MSNRWHGLKILGWTFGIFFFLATGLLIAEKHYGWNQPDLEVHYWIKNKQIIQRKGAV